MVKQRQNREAEKDGRGLFLCASVACRFLDHELDEEDLDGRLRLILEDNDEFREIYAHQFHVCKNILEYHHVGRHGKRVKREKQKAADEIKLILGTIAVLFRPVSIATLSSRREKRTSNCKSLYSVLWLTFPSRTTGR